MFSVCRVCLSGNTRLHSLKNNLLIDVFERLSKTKFNSEDARPRDLCHFCYQKLLKCYMFSQMVHKSDMIFSQPLHEGLEVTQGNITEVNLGMTQHLSVTPIRFVTIDGTASRVTIKHEPIPCIDIKEEVTTEQDKLVNVEYAPENCTRSQLTFEDNSSDIGKDVDELPSHSHVEQTKPDDSKMTFSCNSCNKTFLLKIKLISHLRNSHSELHEKQFTHTMQCTQKTSMIKDKIIPNQKKPFACNVCDKFFYKNCHLVIHMRTHTGERPFACNVCDKKFYSNCSLARHVRTHAGERPFACNVCDKKFATNRTLVRHKTIFHTGEKPYYACNVCQNQYSQRGDLVLHMRTHTGERPFACNVCDKIFCTNRSLARHVRTHAGERPFTCNVCEKKLATNSSLVRHMIFHTGEKPYYACNVCQNQYSQKGYLALHMRIHTGERPFACNVCYKQFSDKGILARHMRSHTGKTFACSICDTQLNDKGVLVRHMKPHAVARPFACNVCHNQFNRKSYLVSHMRTHTGEKPFACNVCHNKFYRKSYLAIHMRTHTGEKPFVCNVCDKRFFRKRCLVRHMKEHVK